LSEEGPQSGLDYDHLVMALGSVSDWSGNGAVAESAYEFKPLSDAIRIRNHVSDVVAWVVGLGSCSDKLFAAFAHRPEAVAGNGEFIKLSSLAEFARCHVCTRAEICSQMPFTVNMKGGRRGKKI
jgi:hypothetical protein